MFGMAKEKLEAIKAQYPAGTRIELIEMVDEPYNPVDPGTKGTVAYIDSIGQLHMNWDNGRSLAIIPWKDRFKVIGKEGN